jgi:tetratricopeptide (TPR) repeat protein
MYRNKESIKENARNKAIPAFHRVYREGDLQMRYDAGVVLRAMGASVPTNVGRATATFSTPRSNSNRSSTTSQSTSSSAFNADECSSSAQKRAKSLERKAKSDFRKKRYKSAHTKYKRALETCNSGLSANFGMAKTCAKLKKIDEANQHLQRLLDIDTEKSVDLLHGARIDGAFENMRQNADFKRITGYAAIYLVNSMTSDDAEKEMGADELRVIRKRLKMLRHHIVKEGDNKRNERISFPRIWFKPASKVQAIFFKDVVDHPDTRLIPIGNGDSKYDIIIAWAQKVVRDEYGEKRPADVARKLDPDNVDASLQSLERKQTNALRKPESILNTTNRVLNTPENIGGSLERSYDRGERLIKRIPGL